MYVNRCIYVTCIIANILYILHESHSHTLKIEFSGAIPKAIIKINLTIGNNVILPSRPLLFHGLSHISSLQYCIGIRHYV